MKRTRLNKISKKRPTVPEMISAIRASVSLQMEEIAAMLMVSRAEVYSWISGDAKPTQSELKALEGIYSNAIATVNDKSTDGSIRELARKHGIDLRHVRDQEGELDLVTGKRNSME